MGRNEKRHRTIIVVLIATVQFAFGLAFILGAALADEQHWGFLVIVSLRDIGLLLATTGTISFVYELVLRRETIDEVMERIENILVPMTSWLQNDLSQNITTQVNEVINPLASFGVRNFYVNRDQLPRIPEQLRRSRSEIFAVGLSLGSLVLDHHQLLVEKALAGCKIKLLMMNPNANGDLNPLVGRMSDNIDTPQYETELRTRLERTKDWIARFRDRNPTFKDRIEVRLYDCVPTLALLMLDADTDVGKITVEMLPYGRAAIDRPSFDLEFKGETSLYRRLHSYYSVLWQKSKHLI